MTVGKEKKRYNKEFTAGNLSLFCRFSFGHGNFQFE